MRKLIVSNIVSLDGYYEGPSKNVMDLFGYRFGAYMADKSFDAYNAERLRAADTLLLGRLLRGIQELLAARGGRSRRPRPPCRRYRGSTTP